MASFQEHIDQAKRNIEFLAITNANSNKYWDWQVTISYYVAVHLVNAHIAKVANLHYRTHEHVKSEISPYSGSACKIDADIYTSYGKLEGLSRRSRYLCHQDRAIIEDTNHVTVPKHFAKAIKNLDKIINYLSGLHSFTLENKPELDCEELKDKHNLNFFTLKKKPATEATSSV